MKRRRHFAYISSINIFYAHKPPGDSNGVYPIGRSRAHTVGGGGAGHFMVCTGMQAWYTTLAETPKRYAENPGRYDPDSRHVCAG